MSPFLRVKSLPFSRHSLSRHSLYCCRCCPFNGVSNHQDRTHHHQFFFLFFFCSSFPSSSPPSRLRSFPSFLAHHTLLLSFHSFHSFHSTHYTSSIHTSLHPHSSSLSHIHFSFSYSLHIHPPASLFMPSLLCPPTTTTTTTNANDHHRPTPTQQP
ncbi:hypothetical protein BKA57DRAFT_444762 [Linnemannia elongata]|nr:hypothetical protein BKA57DRAFT_444762 [Linnemannia elongata]